jgi:hypothetical protein
MFRIDIPVIIVATRDARAALGGDLARAAQCAWREIARAEKGLEIAHHQFAFGRQTLAVCSRVRGDGLCEIELGLGDPRLPRSTFTADDLRAAAQARRGSVRNSRFPAR